MPYNDPAVAETASTYPFPGSATDTPEIWLLGSAFARPFGMEAATAAGTGNRFVI
jgi:hypothetical protein